MDVMDYGSLVLSGRIVLIREKTRHEQNIVDLPGDQQKIFILKKSPSLSGGEDRLKGPYPKPLKYMTFLLPREISAQKTIQIVDPPIPDPYFCEKDHIKIHHTKEPS